MNSFHTRGLLLRANVRSYCINRILKSNNPDTTNLQIKGWVKGIRKQKDLIFVAVNDGSCLDSLQVVISRDIFQPAVTASYGACVSVTGELKPSLGQKQKFDLIASNFEVLGECDSQSFPFKKNKFHPADYCRQFLHLRPRTNTFASLLRIRNSFTHAIHKVLQEDGYIQVNTPILTSNDCEGAGQVFRVEALQNERPVPEDDSLAEDFVRPSTYLTVSGQLHLEAITGAFAKAYTFGPTFRAENSQGRHHLSEFYMLEAELAFTDDLHAITNVVEDLIKKSTAHVFNSNMEDIRLHWTQSEYQETLVNSMMSKPYVRMTYTEAIDTLIRKSSTFKHQVKWGDDLQKEHERFLVKHCDNVPVFVINFPVDLKPFYMKANSDNKTVAAMDLLMPAVGEVCGGSLREANIHVLEKKLDQLKIKSTLEWYLDLRRYGSSPHGGFGLGFERLLQAMLGIKNIKDTIPYPRTLNQCKL